MSSTKPNTQRRIAQNMGIMSILGIVMVFSPLLFNIDPMEGGGALILIGLLLALTGFITYFTFSRRAKLVDDIFDKKNVVAHWKVSGSEWGDFAATDVKATSGNAWFLWGLITFFFVIFTGIFWLFTDDADDANFFVLLMASIWAFISLFAFLATAIRNRKRRSQKEGEVIISKNGLWLNGESHIWIGLGVKLNTVGYHTDKRILEFGYSFPARQGRQIVEVRVPVPANAKKELAAVMGFFGISEQKPIVDNISEAFSAEDNSIVDAPDEEADGFEVKM